MKVINIYIKPELKDLLIEKCFSKIEILFCNISEYNIIKKYVKEIPLVIVTNEAKPVLVITQQVQFVIMFQLKKI